MKLESLEKKVRSEASRDERYLEVCSQLRSLVAAETNQIATMASLVGLLHHAFDEFLWTGFYLVDPDKPRELVIGPYQGTIGCLRIPFGKGVCGIAAESGEIQIVADVNSFPGHIACDTRSNSEIVVPVHNSHGKLIAVLDIDSDRFGAFGEGDAKQLQSIVKEVFSD